MPAMRRLLLLVLLFLLPSLAAPVFAGGASGALAKQIAQGAPTDLFLSAHRKWIDYLVDEGRVAPGAVRTLAANRLVFVGAPGVRAASLGDLPALRRIAIGSPQSVPAGQYAEETLRRAGLFDRLAATGQLVMAQDVRQALVYVDRGEVDGAFVYRSDARLARQAVLLFEVPAELHSPITCPMALTVAGALNPEAAAFFDFLQSEGAKRVLEKHGFIVP
jgi:molybdate transport system substrate-binding protein